MNKLFIKTFAILSLLINCHWALAQNYPNYTSTYVNDFARLLDEQTTATITQQLNQHQMRFGTQMTVVTINSMKDYSHYGEIEPFATGLFNFWGLGNAERNDGILILIATDDRAMRINLGTGYPSYLDQTAKSIIEEDMIPHFKQQNFSAGIQAGVTEAIARLKLDSPPPPAPTKHTAQNQQSKPNVIQWIGQGLATMLFGILGLFGFKRYQRKRPRRCPQCSGLMQKLSETEEDAHLTPGQQCEEYVESVEYDVWYCPMDSSIEVCDYNKWFSGYCTCKYCKNKTVESTTETLSHATEFSTGRERVTYLCKHCTKSWEEYRTIPRVTRSSSSSSSSGSSFGGGSSSGGGASGRW